MTKPMAAAMAATLAFSACDLPTNADEARAHLARNQQERIIPIQLPLPEISVTLADQLGALSAIVDTTDLSFGLDPDTFALGLDSLLAIDPVDPAPVTQGFNDFQIDDFDRQISQTLPAIPINLPGTSPTSIALLPGATGSHPINVTLDAFSTATFEAGSSFLVILSTDEEATVEVDAEIQEEGGGATIAPSDNGPVTLGPSTTDTLVISLGGIALPSAFDLLISFDASAGDGSNDGLTISTEFANAAVTAATGVDASLISPVTFDQAVTLNADAGSDFSRATMASGTVEVVSYDIGSLEFVPDFDGDLTGLQIGGSTPDQIQVSGQVRAPETADRVDITTSADLTIAFTNLEVASVTLNSVSIDVNQTVQVETGGALDDLESVVIDSGALEVALTNRLDVSGLVTITLTGITDADGNVLTGSLDVAPSPDGSPVTSTVTVDLADATLDPAALEPTVTGTISGTDVTVTPERAAEAVTVDPYLEINPRMVVLAGLPDMNIALDQRVPVATENIELGQMGEFLDRISFNDVTFTVTVANATGIDLEMDDFRMTLLDGSGTPILDDDGQPIDVFLGDETTGSALAPAGSETVLSANAASLVNALLDRVAAEENVELSASGAMGPAGDSGTISLGDSIAVVFEMRLGPDITIDPEGITLDRVVHDAVELDSIVSDFMVNLSEDLVSAGIEFEAVNGMPLGLALAMTLAPTPADTTDFDPWSSPNRLDLPRFVIDAGEVDAEGRVTAPTVSNPETQVDPTEFGVLADRALSMGMRAEVLGPDGGRAQLQPTDSLVLRPLLKIEIRVGGNGGTQ